MNRWYVKCMNKQTELPLSMKIFAYKKEKMKYTGAQRSSTNHRQQFINDAAAAAAAIFILIVQQKQSYHHHNFDECCDVDDDDVTSAPSYTVCLRTYKTVPPCNINSYHAAPPRPKQC